MSQAQAQSKRSLVIIGLMLGLLMASLDNTIVSTAMPTVVSDLGGMEIFAWVFSAYLLTSTAFIPIFGKLADLYGKKFFYLMGLSVFILGSVLSGLAETMMQLITYRAIQGLGVSAMMPITFAMIFDLFPPEQRGKMQGVFSAVFGISSLAGPTMGGYFTEHLSWHWIFFINVPFGLISVVLMALFYREAKREKRQVSIDYAGAITLSLAIVALMLGLVMGGEDYAWGSWQILSLLIGAGVLTVVFLLIERRAKEPVIPLQLFNAGLISATGVSFLQGAVMIGAATYIPMFLQGVIGVTASNSGNLLTPMMLAVVVSSTIGGITMAKLPFRVSMSIGSVLLAAGSFLLTVIDPATSKTYMVLAMIVLGLGIGPFYPISMVLATMSLGREHTGVASSLISFFRNIGMALGVSIFGVIVNNKMADTLQELYITLPKGFPPEMMKLLSEPRVLFTPEAREMIPSSVLGLLQDSMAYGIATVFVISLGLAVVTLGFSLLAGKMRLTAPPRDPAAESPEGQTSGTMV